MTVGNLLIWLRRHGAAVAIALAGCSHPAAAQSALLESYTAFIGRDDLYNSSGVRLTQPWAIVRQDRANYNTFGIRQSGDEPDTFFLSPRNRQKLEDMLASGSISRAAASAIVRGNVLIRVDIYGEGDVGRYVDVTVLN